MFIEHIFYNHITRRFIVDENQQTLNELLEQGALTLVSWLKITIGFNNNRDDQVRAAIEEMTRKSKRYGIHEVIEALATLACTKTVRTEGELAEEVDRLKQLVRKHDEMLGELIRFTSAFSNMAQAIRWKMDGNDTYRLAAIMQRLQEHDKELQS